MELIEPTLSSSGRIFCKKRKALSGNFCMRESACTSWAFGLVRVQATNMQYASISMANVLDFIGLSFVVAACKSTRF